MENWAENRVPADDNLAESASLPSDAIQESSSSSALLATVALATALPLAACGGGSSPTAAPPSTPPVAAPPPPVTLTPATAARFLAQATVGANEDDLLRAQSIGYDAWFAEQFSRPRATQMWDWLVTNGHSNPANINTTNGFDAAMWQQLISGNDQLRQRVGLALLDFLVVSINGLEGNWRAFAMASYVDVIMNNAFGNFRTLLREISTNAALGLYLTFRGSKRANDRGAQPDENYARELMQLFTLGVSRLNMDGTVQLSGGNPIETYSEEDIKGLARVFTGWILAGTDTVLPDFLRPPMVNLAADHEPGAKTFLGTTIPANTDGPTSLNLALDTIFAHPNVPPFVSVRLIRRLVTSNPSPAYVGRVAAVFVNNGSGVRGDLRAVVQAILMDSEARNDTVGASSTSFGKQREPILRLTAWARAFNVRSSTQAWAFGDTSSTTTRLGQSAGRAPSVFGFFRPGYTPPNSAIGNASLVAPEFQITNEITVVAYINYMQSLVVNGAGDARPDYTAILTRAADSAALVDQVNLLLAGNQIGATTLAQIRSAVDSIAATTDAGRLNRVHTAILLTLASPEFIVLR